MTDAGLKQLAGLQGLQTLDLGLQRGDGRGAEGTSRPQGAARTDPRRHEATDAGLKGLADLAGAPDAEISVLQGVTDAGLKELAALKGLQKLDLRGTLVTDAGVAELQKACPTARSNTDGAPGRRMRRPPGTTAAVGTV